MVSDIYLNEDNNYVNNWANFKIGYSQSDSQDNSYAGTFDGNGYTIHNLYLDGSEQMTALFAKISGGTVTNFNIENAKFVSQHNGGSKTNSFSGIVCGIIKSGTISEITVSGTATADSDKFPISFGVIAGYNSEGSGVYVTNCSSSVEIDFTSTSIANASTAIGYTGVGGIFGCARKGSVNITGCTNTGNIIAPKSTGVGGILGNVVGTGTVVKNCTNTGNVSGFNKVGAIIGNNQKSIDISTCTPGGQIVSAN